MRLPLLRKIAYGLLTVVFLVCSFNALSIVRDQYKATQALPRNEKLPLFNPHRSSSLARLKQLRRRPSMHELIARSSKRKLSTTLALGKKTATMGGSYS